MIKVYNNLENIEFDENTIVTVGTFDGVHLGHKEILNRLLSFKSKNRTCIVTFHPHPQHILGNKSINLKLLTSINERIWLFNEMGIDSVLVVPFTKEFSNLSARDFIINIIYKKLGLKRFLIGYDHTFGKNREGNYDLLQELSKEMNFEVERIEAKTNDEEQVISSTKIRQALLNRDLELANKYLGWNYIVTGIVREGYKRGRTLGYPTANIVPEEDHKLLPGNGVYVVKSTIGDTDYFGMASVGVRPTFLDNAHQLLEVHFFDLDENLYGKELKIEFLAYIREEKKFDVLDELVQEMNKDKEISLKFLRRIVNSSL